jgi:2-dehydropantoate 2-reductase
MEQAVIAIVGAGAVGAYYGGRLAQHGRNVHFLVRRDYEQVRRSGWTIQSCDGDFRLPPDGTHVYNDAAKMPKADLVIVALKSTSMDQYGPLVRPLVKENTAILALQNGLGNEEKLAELFGAERIMGGIAFVCINRVGPGVVHHMAEGLVRIGEFKGRVTPRLRQLAEMFNASGVECQVVEDLQRARWQKLIWNIPFNALGAALDMTTEQLLASAEGVELVRSIMMEVVAAAKGIDIEFPIGIVEEQIEFTRPMGAYKTSMQVDRQEGRPMELEALLGQPLAIAARCGVATPRLEMLYRMVSLGKLGKSNGNL